MSILIKQCPRKERLQFIVIVVGFVPKAREIEKNGKCRSPKESICAAKIPFVGSREMLQNVKTLHRGRNSRYLRGILGIDCQVVEKCVS
jgi:hypothetical protein